MYGLMPASENYTSLEIIPQLFPKSFIFLTLDSVHFTTAMFYLSLGRCSENAVRASVSD